MPRPIKCRRVEFIPNENNYFVPGPKGKGKGKGYQHGKEMKEINLKVEELEAMRLKDVVGLSQQEAADKMDVSRQTFQNIIDSARNKVAKALLKGWAISISGGNYEKADCTHKHQNRCCNGCGWGKLKSRE